ncbi:MAG: DUF5946 family protein [Chloroflexia bacterium]
MEEAKKITCFGCGALVPDIEGPIHAYMLSAPGCWRIYGEILAKEYTPEYYDADSHRISVDAYAVTHPGRKERKAIQSVNIHLIRLYHTFETNLGGEKLLQVIKKAADDETLHKELVWRTPPMFENTLHVTDVLKAKDTEEHKKIVRSWGESVWKVWKDKHGDTIESLAMKIML